MVEWFDAVYLNDPSTIHRHRNARYLPVAYDTQVHHENGHTRNYQVGFIGGHNNARERYLLALQEAGLLSYVVGGPWQSKALRSLCLSPNIPASATADLYKQTRIVVNLFREVHHFNECGVKAFSMNPRIYEALACGAVVVSETRGELSTVFPDVPLFSNDVELVDTIGKLIQSDEAYSAVKKACREKLAAHSYRERLLHVLATLDLPTAAASVEPKPRQEVTMTNVQLSFEGWTTCEMWSDRPAKMNLRCTKPPTLVREPSRCCERTPIAGELNSISTCRRRRASSSNCAERANSIR